MDSRGCVPGEMSLSILDNRNPLFEMASRNIDEAR